ncbi:MAG: DUF1573 domain-containing protein, partial [Bacteroidales bacterium]|nr:DUF1573 domain-containing protein [Bacteroidales bacterium]
MKKTLFLFLILTVFACKDKKLTEARQIVSEWVGKEIHMPDNVLCTIMGKDTVSDACLALMDAEYKVLLYVDSSGCSSCRLRLFQWKTLMSESDSLFREKVSFLFFFQPKSKKELDILFWREQFNYPVFIDMKNNINRINHFPAKPEYQCFLLDKDNKVQMIGNPASTPKMWNLYKQVISGQQTQTVIPVTSVSIEQSEIELKDLQTGKTSETTFKLKNTGTQPLIIQMVNASCGCTVPEWEKQPIAAGKSTEIKVKITPEQSE